MDYKRYENKGWGLSMKSFEVIYKLFEEELSRLDTKLNIVEFGSGTSTRFFCDTLDELSIDADIVSFDNDERYCYPGDDERVKLYLVDLIETTEQNYGYMFKNREFRLDFFKKKKTPVHSRQQNTFYSVGDKLPHEIHFVLVDGPHGNGRSTSFLHLLDKNIENCYIFVDDLTHYPFETRLRDLFEIEVISKETNQESDFENQANYGLYKIIKRK